MERNFLKKSEVEWLMVYDEKVKIHLTTAEIEKKLADLPTGTEAFPYDKLADLKKVTSPQL